MLIPIQLTLHPLHRHMWFCDNSWCWKRIRNYLSSGWKRRVRRMRSRRKTAAAAWLNGVTSFCDHFGPGHGISFIWSSFNNILPSKHHNVNLSGCWHGAGHRQNGYTCTWLSKHDSSLRMARSSGGRK
jgi:hypothetical protein